MTGITSRTYTEHGQPVTIAAAWRSGPPPLSAGGPGVVWLRPPGRPPRNVLVRRASGALVVRPFRGLRKPPTPHGGTP